MKILPFNHLLCVSCIAVVIPPLRQLWLQVMLLGLDCNGRHWGNTEVVLGNLCPKLSAFGELWSALPSPPPTAAFLDKGKQSIPLCIITSSVCKQSNESMYNTLGSFCLLLSGQELDEADLLSDVWALDYCDRRRFEVSYSGSVRLCDLLHLLFCFQFVLAEYQSLKYLMECPFCFSFSFWLLMQVEFLSVIYS